jgi:predicted DNA-binding transcriptional regulator AlpA
MYSAAVHDVPVSPPSQLIAIKRIARSLNVSVPTITRMVARGDFPKWVDLGFRKKQFLLSEIERWWRTRLGGATGAPFPLADEHADDYR